MTGRRWTRPAQTHPDWCRQGHVCDFYTRPSSGGQHRSAPLTADTPYGRLVYTQVESRTEQVLEFRAVIRLDPRREVAVAEAAVLMPNVDEAIRASLARTNLAVVDLINAALDPATIRELEGRP